MCASHNPKKSGYEKGNGCGCGGEIDADKGVLAQKTELPGIYPSLLLMTTTMTSTMMMTMMILMLIFYDGDNGVGDDDDDNNLEDTVEPKVDHMNRLRTNLN